MAEEIDKIIVDKENFYIDIVPAVGNPFRLNLSNDIRQMIRDELVPQLESIESDIVMLRTKRMVEQLGDAVKFIVKNIHDSRFN